MKIYLAADHRGLHLKEELKKWLIEEKHDVIDCGNFTYEPFDDAVDFAKEVADKMLLDPTTRQYILPSKSLGIVMCGSGIAFNIAMNRYKHIRCALAANPEQIRHGVEKDYINAISLPAEFISFSQAQEIVRIFLTSKPIPEDKHLRRINKLDT